MKQARATQALENGLRDQFTAFYFKLASFSNEDFHLSNPSVLCPALAAIEVESVIKFLTSSIKEQKPEATPAKSHADWAATNISDSKEIILGSLELAFEELLLTIQFQPDYALDWRIVKGAPGKSGFPSDGAFWITRKMAFHCGQLSSLEKETP